MLDVTVQTGSVITHRLETGVLTLNLQAEPEKELFRLAERVNPKRSFLFVSTVLGRHIPVRPSDHMGAVKELVQRLGGVRIPGPILVVGYAETAVGLGAAVARELASRRSGHDLLYLSTTRHPVPGREWVRFSEGHSHATEHHVLRPDPHAAISSPDSTLVLVDDETTTGATFAALTQSLLRAGVRFARVILVTLTDWSDGAAVRAVSALDPAIPVSCVSLMRGSWSWAADPSVQLPELPGPISPAYPEWVPSSGVSPRDGVRDWSGAETDRLAAQLDPQPGEQILIIGTGEQIWAPMLLAERLEQGGAEVRVIATTRSPILPGEVIQHKLTFPDHFGIGVPMYLHNTPPHPQGRVVVMTETGADRICPALRTHLGRGIIIDGSGQLTEFCES